VTALALGNGLINPSIMGSISVLANDSEQGEAMGVSQSLSSLGRIFGPAVGGLLYSQTRFLNLPFLVSSGLVCFGIFLFMSIFAHVPSYSKAKG
jgi:DHA1 family tetracycline resistance protein-like MFS transporter